MDRVLRIVHEAHSLPKGSSFWIELGASIMARMAPRTKKAFDFFVDHANKIALHPNDWDRFYKFVRTAHRYRSRIWEQDVKQALIEAGFGEDYARKLCIVYTHCWRMLNPRSPMEEKEWRLEMKYRRQVDEEVRRQVEGYSFRSPMTAKERILEIKELRRQVEEGYRRP